jgi:hypothetical protein
MRIVRTKDILVSRKEELEKEIKALKKQLQKLCEHQFVIGRVGAESYDFGDTCFVPGYRLCVVCESGERATSSRVHSDGPWREREETFPTLNENFNRVVDKHGFNSRNPLDIWQPLEEVLKTCFVDKRVYEMIKT